MKLTNEQIKAKYPNTAERIIGERRVVRKLITKAIEQGFTVSLHNGEDWEVRYSQSVKDLMDNTMATDCDHIYIHEKATGDNVCRFYLVYGNSPAEVIADHSDTPYATSLYDHATEGEE